MNKLTEQEPIDGKWFLAHWKLPEGEVVFDKDFPSKLGKPKLTIKAPSGYFYADPLGFKYNSKFYIFFENFDYRWGKISYYVFDEDLNMQDFHQIKDIDIDLHNHCSFPYVFEDDGKIWMIPESSHLNNINLYECISFPDKWRLKKTLIPHAHAGDTTVIKRDGIYWMFTYILRRGRYRYCIYYTDNLLGEWKSHNLVNSDYDVNNEHLTRGAGQPFLYNGRFYRPSQYSNGSINGEGVILNELKSISHNKYHEVPVTLFSHRTMRNPKFRCCHTFSFLEGGIISMDFRLKRDSDPEPIGLDSSKLPEIMEQNYYVDHKTLEEVFAMNTSGNGKNYYGCTIGGRTYTGERNWDLRWNLIKNAQGWLGKRVLDVGCNTGILLSYLKKFRNIAHGTGVDQPDSLLLASNKRDTIKAAKMFVEALSIDDIDFRQIDLNDSDYETMLGTNYDCVCALSIHKWIEDKDRFVKYCSQFKTILWEGHEADEIEISRFPQYKATILGKTQTGASYSQNNHRTMILFERN